MYGLFVIVRIFDALKKHSRVSLFYYKMIFDQFKFSNSREILSCYPLLVVHSLTLPWASCQGQARSLCEGKERKCLPGSPDL